MYKKVKLESCNAYYFLLFTLGALFYIVNFFTPLSCDDWHYGYIFGTSTHIQSICDVFHSQYIHYFSANGRLIPHLLLQTCDGLLNKDTFNIANAFVFMLFIHMLNVNFVKERVLFFKSTCFISCLIILFLCGFDSAFLWMSGAFNYLWGFTLLLIFNYIFYTNINNYFFYLLLFLGGVICGWTNEAYIVGYLCGMLYFLHKNRLIVKSSQIILLGGLLLGACFLCFSPGSIQRSGVSSMSFSLLAFIKKIVLSLIQMNNLRFFFVALVLLILRKECRNHWAVAMIISFCFVLLTGFNSGQSRFGIEMFALIIIISELKLNRLRNRVVLLFASISIIVLASSIPYCVKNYELFKEMERNVETSSDGIIPLKVSSTPFPLSRFVVHYDVYNDGTNFEGNDKFNNQVARYYNKKTPLVFIQDELLVDIRSNIQFNDFECPSKYMYYVREWNEQDSIHSIKYIFSPSKLVYYPYFRTLDRFRLNEMEVSEKDYRQIVIDGKNYLFVAKNKVVDNRVVNLVVY